MIIKTVLTLGLIFSLLRVGNVWAQPALDIKNNPLQTDQQRVEKVSPPPVQNTVRTQTPTTTQNPKTQEQTTSLPNRPSEELQNLQTQVKSLENQLRTLQDQSRQPSENSRANGWFSWWWQIGFWMGILWLALWIFVGWQWAHFKFWGFGWPWPWWFWIPLVWFIPWFIIAWQWWLVWWLWWVWIWWIFPWFFWIFWWIILFKESTIWVWHRRKPSSIDTE